MSERVKPLRQALRYCGDCLLLLACWALWLCLGALLALQVAIVVSKEFSVPAFALRALEERFAAASIHAHFGRATFDVRGGLLLENVRLSLPEFSQPVVEVRALYLELEPWLLPTGRLEPRRVRATGATLYVPAMLAPSGRHEAIVRNLDFSLVPRAAQLELEYASGELAGMVTTLRGLARIPGRVGAEPPDQHELLAQLARSYPALCRQLIRAREQLAALEHPQLDVVLRPAATRGAIASVTLTADAWSYPRWRDLAGKELRATTDLPLLGQAPSLAPLQLTAAEVTLAGATATQVTAELEGVLQPATFYYQPQTLRMSVGRVESRGFTLEQAAGEVRAGPLPQLSADVRGRLLGAPVAIAGEADLSQRTATATVEGLLAPGLLEPLTPFLKRDIRPFVGFGEPIAVNARATFAPGWQFAQLTGHIAAQAIDAYHVPMDSVRGEIELDRRRFHAHHAVARMGENFARGSFTQEFPSREYRFLLNGRLRPGDIGGWFRSWWQDVFEHFEFPLAPPEASVDVAGRWRAARETTVFLFAESNGAVIRGGRLDYARTLMFIRPNFLDGLELYGTRGVGDIRGTFTRSYDMDRRDWLELELGFASTLDLETGAKLLGPTFGPRLADYTFEHAPELQVHGRFSSPTARNGAHQELRIKARSHGDFSVFRFPGQNLSFEATLHDDDLAIDNVSAAAAGGEVSGHARLWGPPTDRRLGFDAAVQGASLGRAVTAVTEYLALRRGQSQGRSDRLLPGKNTARLDLAISVEGRVQDPLSFVGSGNASVDGPELGEVRLLGLLSELLNFTALRFTHAQGDFKVEGPNVTFRSVSITGANSAIHAHGSYSLARRNLDFNARVYPFQESTSLLQNVFGVMLTPLSAVLEVKLTGALDDPQWAFVIGPTHLLRTLTTPTATPEKPAETPPQVPSS